MKKLIAFALFALLTTQGAYAKTYYVNAKRPNNKGNGLKVATAFKTLQYAINKAKNGDTIIVYPGKYARISTKNKKIVIKSKSGKSKTKITNAKFCDESLFDGGSGTKSKITGFTFADNYMHGTMGGTLANCDFKGVGEGLNDSLYGKPSATFYKSSFKDCLFSSCYACTGGMGGLFLKSSLNRCTIENSRECYPSKSAITSSTLYNCLLTDNTEGLPIFGCTLMNCTIADNTGVSLSKNKAYNTIFYKVATSQFKKAKKNTLKNCYKGANPKFVSTQTKKKTWDASNGGWESRLIGAEVYWDNGFSGAEVQWFSTSISGAAVYWNFDDGSTYQDGYATVSGTTYEEVIAAAKTQVGLPDANYSISYYTYDEGYVTATGKTDAAIIADAKAKVGKPDADYYISYYNYDEGYVTVTGKTDAAILAAAKKKIGKPNASYSISYHNYEYGQYKTVNIPGDYRLKKESPCINKGKLTAAQKKLVGTKDLAGKKRIKGKAVDIGCYEY